MKHPRQNGLVFVMAMLTLAMVGAAVFVLGNSSRAMLFDANYALLEAQSRNLKASGLGWVRRNDWELGKKLKSGRIELDVTDLEIPRATLTVSIDKLPAGKRVRIHTTSRRGKLILNRTFDCPLPAGR